MRRSNLWRIIVIRNSSLATLVFAIAFVILLLGCSGNDNPATPAMSAEKETVAAAQNHNHLWGYFGVTIDPDTLEASVLPLRTAEFTANIVTFMQPPSNPVMMSVVIIGSESDLPNGYAVCDVTLMHPFPELPMYRGFDVRGILLGDSTYVLQTDTTASFGGEDDVVLENADGYSRWWNKSEFGPQGTIFGYTQGILATGGFNPTASINGFKYFSDELGPTSLFELEPSTRGTFSPSMGELTRRYEIQFDMIGGAPQINFAYAVSASYADPDPSGAPYYPVQSFPPDANCQEPYKIADIQLGSSAWYVDETNNGGHINLHIEVFDWQAPDNPDGVPGELTALYIEGEPFTGPIDLLAIAEIDPGTNDTSAIFKVILDELDLHDSGLLEVWITALSSQPNTYEPQIEGNTSMFTWPGKPLTAFHRTFVYISPEPIIPSPVVTAIDPSLFLPDLSWDATVTGENFVDGCSVQLRESNATTPHVIDGTDIVFIDSTAVDCTFDFTGAPVGMYDVILVNPDTTSGTLEEGAEVIDGSNIIFVDNSHVGTENGTMANPFTAIQDAVDASSYGMEIWVDDSGIPYNEHMGGYALPEVQLIDGIFLKSINWDSSDGGDRATIEATSLWAAISGADDAVVEGFDLDCSRFGVECIGTSPEIIDCRIKINWADGMAVRLMSGSHAQLRNVEIYDVSNSGYSYGSIFGIWINGCDAVGSDRVIIENCSVHNLYTTGGSYTPVTGLSINSSDGVHVTNFMVYDVNDNNWADVWAITAIGSNDVELTNVVVQDINKTTGFGDAYGIYFWNCMNIDIRNTIVTDISRVESGLQGAYGIRNSGVSSYTFEYNNVWNCDSANLSNVTPGPGCLSVDPEYVDPETNYHLDTGSPCIDAGDPSILDPDNSTSDMGAYGGPGADDW